MRYFRPQILCVSIALVAGMPENSAARSFHFRAPDGSITFTGKPLRLPYRLEKRLVLNQREPETQEVVSESDTQITAESAKSSVAIEPVAVVIEPGERPDYAAIVDVKSEKYKVIPELIHAVIEAESAYNPKAISHAGAVGLMQLMPATAERFGVTDRTNPTQNIDGGVRYLRFLLDYFDNDLKLAIAGYNAGEGAVLKYGRKIPPYRETRNYVAKVLKLLQRNLERTRPQYISTVFPKLANSD